jgi:DNA transformation protein
MKTTPYLEHILYDVFDERDNVTARAMMGGYVLYMEGKVFAIVDKDELWFKGSNELASWYISRGARKFSYMKEGKEQGMNYFSVPEVVLEDREIFDEWVEQALSVANSPRSKVRKVESKCR